MAALVGYSEEDRAIDIVWPGVKLLGSPLSNTVSTGLIENLDLLVLKGLVLYEGILD